MADAGSEPTNVSLSGFGKGIKLAKGFGLLAGHGAFIPEEGASSDGSDPGGAAAYLSTGEHPRDESLPVAEHAAYAAVAGLILNLDEVITKP